MTLKGVMAILRHYIEFGSFGANYVIVVEVIRIMSATEM